MMPKRESNRVTIHRSENDRIPVSIRAWTLDDSVLSGMCKRCGMAGAHPTAANCIDALRDRLSKYE